MPKKDYQAKLAYNREWARANPDRVAIRNRKAQLKRLYGISPEQYDEILQSQYGVCAGCLRPPGKKRLAVDHDHETGVVRGLLCEYCNRAVGLLGDSPITLNRLTKYLEGANQ